MATKTATAATAPNTAKVAIVSPVTRVFTVPASESATLSAGDVVLLPWGRIPTGATVVDAKISGKLMDGTAIIVPFLRDPAGTDTTLGSLTLSVAGRIGNLVHSSAGDSAHVPFTLTASDDASVRYSVVGFTVGTTASPSTSASLSLILTYVMDK